MQWFAWDACLKCDYTCCSKIEGLHLPFQCKFNDNKTLASYAKGIYDYYDVERIEEFVAFKGAYEIASLLEKYDDVPYKFENLSILQ